MRPGNETPVPLRKPNPSEAPVPFRKRKPGSELTGSLPRWRGRYVPAAIRRAVFERDEARCTYTGDSGERCREMHRLELHHTIAFARGGEHSTSNLTLRCHAHNVLAAEEDFGKGFVPRESRQAEGVGRE
jgi:5-methylcytosine-specific restriction endonuclease McrA